MKVLVTGASGVFGRATTERLAMEGHDVVATSRSYPKYLPAGAEWIRADIRDETAVAKAMAGCDAVVHMAWTLFPLETREATREVDVGGTVNVLSAMERTGSERLVFCSSVMAYGASPLHPNRLVETDERRPAPDHGYSVDKRDCEDLIEAAGADALLVRPSVVAGRGVDNATLEGLALPVIPTIRGVTSRMQFIHPDDIGRFFALGVVSELTGPVNLGADDVLTLEEVARILGKPTIALSESVLRKASGLAQRYDLAHLDPGSFDAMVSFPIVDTTRLKEEFGFRCAWSSAEAVHDLRRASQRFFFLGKKRVDIPWRLLYPSLHNPDNVPPPDGEELVPAADADVAGEFDSLIDPRLDAFTAANLSEAFAGPLTPLTLEYAASAMRKGGEVMAHLISAREPLATQLTTRPASVFGHGLYGNLSIIHAMVQAMPGGDTSALWDEALFGGMTVEEDEEVATDPPGPLGAAAQALHVLPRVAGFSIEIDTVEREARRLCVPEARLPQLTDERLHARLALLRDTVEQAWSVSTTATAMSTGINTLLEQQAPGAISAIRSGTEDLPSARALRAVERLAELARSQPDVLDILRDQEPAAALVAVRSASPSFASAFDEVIAAHGHRGPRETELANPVFADAPERLLDAVAKHLRRAPAPPSTTTEIPGRIRPLVRIAQRYQRERERARDALMRLTHAYRQTARECGRRHVERGVIDDIGDAFYLLSRELIVPPDNARELVAQRRADRERLSKAEMPIHFQGSWAPVDTEHPPLRAGEKLTGLSASAGVVSGPVRVLDLDTIGDLQPGEVLVAHLTDTGWTPLFAYASAVVTDVGGPMSHAAVVAREYGIPCVVQTVDATTRLRTGQTVEIDGAAGTVTALDDGL
ncbi:MAG: NAD-dependent epimerase/dehydratase family protein [Actinobacteria bacterium]|nr:NAD-dependent epimerase/dehydratase family protein [Actinomycetota bacterium]